jgi:hypothetical protein
MCLQEGKNKKEVLSSHRVVVEDSCLQASYAVLLFVKTCDNLEVLFYILYLFYKINNSNNNESK